MKIDELVASTRPNISVRANSFSAGPPNSASGAIARNKASEVPIVRESVSLMLRSMISLNGLLGELPRFSRTRS